MAKAITSYITGPVLYANVFERNKITPKVSEYAPEGGQYSIMIGVDKTTARKIKGWSKMHKSRSVDDYEDGEAPDEPTMSQQPGQASEKIDMAGINAGQSHN